MAGSSVPFVFLLAAVYLLAIHSTVVGQSTNSTSSNSTNSTIRVCNGTVLVITLPTNGYPWFFGYPPVGGGGPQFGHKHGGRGRG
ncbi:Protein of unknown function [Gryllus bimaculatus]|nr:Protein of unknown function [Gryllus bimaculatus]